MNDEVQQTSLEVFDRIILGLTSIGLAGGFIAWAIDGLNSPWFLRSIALLVIVLIAFILRWTGQFVIATYVLVLELIGSIASIFLEANSVTGLTPYLLIPTAIIAGLILPPQAAIAITFFAIALTLVIVFAAGQFIMVNLMALLPPFGLLLLAAFLSTIGGSYRLKLAGHLAESSKLLRERTLELIKSTEKTKELQGNMADFEQRLAKTKAAMDQNHQITLQKDQRLHNLIQSTLQELKNSVREIEQAIGGMAETSRLASQPAVLDEAWQKLDHLTHLVISMEELSQFEADEFRLEYRIVDMTQFLRELSEVVREMVKEKNLELSCSISPDIPSLEADPTRLRQALLHVLSNAVKYTNQGMVEIQTELTEKELLIFISDTGVGMSAETIKTLFYDVVQENRQQYGRGLSLAITKRLIELHGGRIWATSVPEIGSTFSIALPLQVMGTGLNGGIPSAKPSAPTSTSTPPATPSQSIPSETKTNQPA